MAIPDGFPEDARPDVDDTVDDLSGPQPVETRSQARRLDRVLSADVPSVGPLRPDLPPAGSLDEQEIDLRSELAARVAGAHFPARAGALVSAARGDGAREGLVRALAGLPADRSFDNVEQVWEALGGPRDTGP
jgi:hypothetical protein